MFSVPRFIGGLAAAGLSAIVAMPTAQAASTVGYQDPLCTAFYTDPLSAAPAQTLKCAKLVCGVTTDVSYLQPVNGAVHVTVNCTNPVTPTVLTYKWVVSPQSPVGCAATLPGPPADTAQTVTVSSTMAQTCWYEAIATDGANPPNTGWLRYGVKWQ